MKNTIQLSIPNPCSQKWENFTPTSTGGYCSSCYKTVVDFTKMSDAEIAEVLKSMPAHTCGRLRNDQLKGYKELPVYSIRPSRMLLTAGMIGLLLAFVGKPSLAQTVAEPAKKEIMAKASQRTTVAEHYVSGVVRDEEDVPMPGVNIVLVGSKEGTTTDADGRFEFPRRLKEGDVLSFAFIGFVTELYSVTASENQSITIKLEADVRVLGEVVRMGEVSVDTPYEPKKSNSLVAMIKRWF